MREAVTSQPGMTNQETAETQHKPQRQDNRELSIAEPWKPLTQNPQYTSVQALQYHWETLLHNQCPIPRLLSQVLTTFQEPPFLKELQALDKSCSITQVIFFLLMTSCSNFMI